MRQEGGEDFKKFLLQFLLTTLTELFDEASENRSFFMQIVVLIHKKSA